MKTTLNTNTSLILVCEYIRDLLKYTLTAKKTDLCWYAKFSLEWHMFNFQNFTLYSIRCSYSFAWRAYLCVYNGLTPASNYILPPTIMSFNNTILLSSKFVLWKPISDNYLLSYIYYFYFKTVNQIWMNFQLIIWINKNLFKNCTPVG